MLLKFCKLTLLIFATVFLSSCADEETVPNEVFEAKIFDTPLGSGSAKPAAAGESYSFTFTAQPGQKLTFATMYITSNDLFLSRIEAGIDLYKDEEPVEGEIINRIILVDAGTEENQVIGAGADQADRQGSPNTGARDPNTLVRLYGGNDAEEIEDLVRVTITHDSGTFTLKISVLSSSTSPISPGVFAVFTGENPIFKLGETDRGNGLEALAEDGVASELVAHLVSLIK